MSKLERLVEARRFSSAPRSIRMRGCWMLVRMRRCATFLRHTSPSTRQLSPLAPSPGTHFTCVCARATSMVQQLTGHHRSSSRAAGYGPN